MTKPAFALESRPSPRYRGRFAPSPSGSLHFGSLVAALGSCLDARVRGGEWLLRIEDVDTPRTVPGAADDIRRVLAAFGFEWDGEVIEQSQRLDSYRAALEHLRANGDAYPCACSRREIAAASAARSADGGLLYPGTCRSGLPPSKSARAWRLRTPDAEIRFTDRVQGEIVQNPLREAGDCVLLRADGLFAYQLAVVVDDAAQGINAVVRGADLIASTARQIWLQKCLNLPTPSYAHLPVALDANGEKLAKQSGARAVEPCAGSAALAVALRFLGQSVPEDLPGAPLAEFWSWAIAHWTVECVPAVLGQRADSQHV